MATQSLYCTDCRKKSPCHQKLFDVLYDFQRKAPAKCPDCGGERELHLTLDFQLGAGDSEFKVVSAILPEKLDSWLGQEEEEVTFYPFLIILQRIGDGKQFCWMPYWHVTGKEARYGQHALCLDKFQLEDLVAQTREKKREEVLEPV